MRKNGDESSKRHREKNERRRKPEGESADKKRTGTAGRQIDAGQLTKGDGNVPY